MIPIARLKNNLEFNNNLGELIEVMKLAAILQFNQFRSTNRAADKFSRYFEEIFKSFASRMDSSNKYIRAAVSDPAIIILISSDEGFLGELNALLINKLVELRQEQDKIIVLGRQGADYLEELNIDFKLLDSVSDKLEIAPIETLVDKILQVYSQGRFSKVCVVYANFVNITSLQIESETLLPLSAVYFYRAIEDNPEFFQKSEQDFLFEPDFDAVVEGWVRAWLASRFYHFFGISKLAEFSARVMHLENSMRELTRLNQHLRLEYFKYLHGLSDKTIREIFASRLRTNIHG